MKIIRFSITELKNKAVDEPLYFDETVDVSELAVLDNNDIRKIDPVKVKGFATVERSEILFSFSIEGEMILPCARTLVDVPYPFSIQATEIFSTEKQLNENEQETGVHQIFEEMLDLTPYIKENIILEMPYRVFSNEEALDKGTGWKFYIEDEYEKHESEKVDPRLAKLQQLLDHNNDNKDE